MANQVITSVENSFTKGLVTEFTGMNFPENAATDCDNTVFEITGVVNRRLGIDFEDNFSSLTLVRTNNAINTYVWNNAGGDGNTKIFAAQVGSIVHFYSITAATPLSPLSANLLPSVIDISTFVAANGTFDSSKECSFSDGNGYLFILHPSSDPVYCTFVSGTITATRINIQTRDFTGTVDDPNITLRPADLSDSHYYNLQNQGWTWGNSWSASSSNTLTFVTGTQSVGVQSGLTISTGDSFIAYAPIDLSPTQIGNMAGTVVSYSGNTLVISVTIVGGNGWFTGLTGSQWTFVNNNPGPLSIWNTNFHNYPSNSDVWWYFKNSSGVFSPSTTINQITANAGRAPRGHFILNEFNQTRGVLISKPSIATTATSVRPRVGTWFQGRMWYTGVDSTFPATGVANNYSWSENIYFSQVIEDVSQFGYCYQVNDPTSETLFDLLPTDGGIIRIQGCGSIYKLFPIQNGILVFASNGIWFITGSQGIGFSANDYTITKISQVQSISSTSFVNVQGLPYFWNEEGIYVVEPSKNGSLEVNPITVGTILSFYNKIPLSSKKHARADYNPIDYVIQWVYRGEEASSVQDAYQFNKILNYNTYNKAFYPYTVSNKVGSINGINYIAGPGGLSSIEPTLRYFSSFPFTPDTSGFTISEEKDTTYIDWASSGFSIDYLSYFVTGYKLHGQAQRRFQIPYIYMFSNSEEPTSYKIQGIWDYASDPNSGRWSVLQLVNNWSPRFKNIFRRHRIRGQGLVLQIKVQSVSGKPFSLIGWSTFETQNTGV